MPCYHSIKGYRAKGKNESGKRSIAFNLRDGYHDMPVAVPCGQCIGCRLERSRQWAIRCVHEASLYKSNCFITLTYSDENLPKDNTLVLKHFQDFMKRLRKHVSPEKVRFFHCGEYGEKYKRPHYHACIFNYDFADKQLYSKRGDNHLYISDTLAKLWPYGFSTIGEVNFETAAYVARYITKKITGDLAVHHYNDIDYDTGEVLAERLPEYTTMSRRPGIGKGWYDMYKGEVFPDDFIVIRGRKVRVPKFYDYSFELDDPEQFKTIKHRRKTNAEKNPDNKNPFRLEVKETIKKIRMEECKRSLEEHI